MRILPSDEHQARKEKMLQAVVHLYIKTGKPVGSTTIVDNYHLNLSPATIRNVLAELETDGFLTHPHTSAGRVPTDKGYRSYVDSIVQIQKLAAEEEQKIKEEYSRRRREIDDLMMSTTRVLSALSNCAGFILPPTVNIEKLRRVELVPVDDHHVLGVLVSQNGFVRNQMIEVSHLPDDETLRSASRLLNERLQGLGFAEAQTRLVGELAQLQRQQSDETELFSTLSKHLFEAELKKDIYVEGTNNMLKFPEFQDYESMRNFAEFVDEKDALEQVLMKGLNQKGLQVWIGSERAPELKDFSVVTSTYQVKGHQVGVLGILGPKRMQYERMMAIVDTVAKLMNRALDGHRDFLEGPDRGK